MPKQVNFTDEQLNILAITKGTHLVLAPPGSGKTELLAARVEKAIHDGYKENDIICLTFTNRAAKGMKDRIESKFPGNSIIIGNIHHYCSRFLFTNHLLPQNMSVLDEEDSDNILKEAMADIGYPKPAPDKFGRPVIPKVYNPELLKLNTFLKQKSLNFPDGLLIQPDIRNIPQYDLAVRVCKGYEALKNEYDLIDFDDILTLSYKFLRDKKDGWSISTFSWIQVDEVQDLNPLQWAILKLIAHKDCLAVYFGDYEQAIFSFMGARLQSLHAIEAECKSNPINGIHNLQRNFRSPSYLLNIFVDYAVALLNPVWKKPPLANTVTNAGADYLRIYNIDGEVKKEAELIATGILPAFLKEGSTTAIIVRFNNTADIISQTLTKKGIQHFKISGFDLFRRESVKGLMAFLSVLDNTYDRMSWARLFYIFGKMRTLKESRMISNALFRSGMIPQDILNDEWRHLKGYYNSWNSHRIIIFDTETTGLDTAEDDIIQIAAIEMINGVPGRSFEVYLKTTKDLSATMPVHGISKEFLDSNGVSPAEGLRKFAAFLGEDPVLLAHNLQYDKAILLANLERYTDIKLDEIIRNTIDSLTVSKLLYTNLHSYNLKDLLEHLKLPGVNSHNAKDDVEATGYLMVKMMADAVEKIHIQDKLIEENKALFTRFKKNFRDLFFFTSARFKEDIHLEKIIQDYFNFGAIELDQQEQAEVQKLIRHITKATKNDNTTTLEQRIGKYIPGYKTYHESDLIVGDEQVYLSTVYKAKGLEFDNIIVAEAVTGVYPSWASDTNEKKAEDARALYVALSRAKKRLYITSHSRSTNQYGKIFPREPSPFLRHIHHHFQKGGNR